MAVGRSTPPLRGGCRIWATSQRLVWVLLGAVVSANAATAQTPDAPHDTAAARALASEYLAAYQARYPESDPTNREDLFDNRIEAEQAWSGRESAFLERLRRIAPNLSPGSAEATTLALLRERLEMSQQFRVCRRELWNVSPLTGWLNEYRAHAARQPVGSEAERGAALTRWSKLPHFIDREIANLQAGLRAGYAAPQQLVQATVEQADQILALPTAGSPFFSPAVRDSSPAFRASMEELVRDRITPALQRYRDYLFSEYAAHARQSVGIAALPDGAACFRALVRRYTTLDTAPSELSAKGRRLMATGDANAIRARERALLADPANRFDSSREALATMTAALQRAGDAAPQWFNRLPEPLVPLVDSMPDGGPSDPDAVYVPGSGGEPPRVYVNVPRILEPGGRLYAERLAFHEGIPGHHLQSALQSTADVHPLNRMLWNAGLGEGWAVYASNLADDMGLYSSDASRIGLATSRLDDGLTYVVQHGLHVLGWTREQAVDTMLRHSGAERGTVEQQVDYFIAAPAHALAYPAGARYIEELKLDASRRLGALFEVRRFHDLILESGSLPLTALREAVERWIETELEWRAPNPPRSLPP